jgi:hypothetical protein
VTPKPDRRRAILIAALGFLRYPPKTHGLAALRAWLDTWSGIGLIVVGMERQHYTVSIRKVADEWVASFHHDPMSAPSGFGSGDAPWHALQQAAWAAVKRSA